ncbi:arginine--tRNA ligase [bacterium]|nr:arginine--tRNA ligase [bacterium]
MRDIKSEIGNILHDVIHHDFQNVFPSTSISIKDDNLKITSSQKREHGDFSSGVCMVLAKFLKFSPHKLAEIIKEKIEAKDIDFISKVEVAGSGYLNFFLHKKIYYDIIRSIIENSRYYGGKKVENPQKIQIEFVSANPTGPMNVVNARAAAIGDTLANVLKNAGHEVTKEYYINDSGVQVQNLGLSVEARMRELLGQKVDFPENGYHGEYIVDIAKRLLNELDKDIWDKEPSFRLEIIKDKSLDLMVEEQKSSSRIMVFTMMSGSAKNPFIRKVSSKKP